MFYNNYGKKYAILAKSHTYATGKFEKVENSIEASTPLEAIWAYALKIQKKSWDELPDYMRTTLFRPVLLYTDIDGTVCMNYKGRVYELEVEEA